MSFEDFERQHFNEEILPRLLANETACRMLLNKFVKRGIYFNKEVAFMTHEECQDAIIAVFTDLYRQEMISKLRQA